MSDFRDLHMYKKAFENAMLIFGISKTFPIHEKYGLTSQIRDSSRSVCSNMAEGYRKRRYQGHFFSKMSDADRENSDTIVWLDFAIACGYISMETHTEMIARYEEVGRILQFALVHPKKFGSYPK